MKLEDIEQRGGESIKAAIAQWEKWVEEDEAQSVMDGKANWLIARRAGKAEGKIELLNHLFPFHPAWNGTQWQRI